MLTTFLRPLKQTLKPFSMSQRSFSAACCIIGDEILNGKTRDSNAYFLANYLFELGIDLKRVEVIPDDYEAIEETIRRLSNKHDLVFTSGGIGPTHDDITYAALAKTFNLPLKLDQETCERMEASSKSKFPDWSLTEERKRMATFPEPSEKVRNHNELWVPVVVVNKNVHVLPGIPRLFEGLLESLRPRFQSMLGDHAAAYHRIQIATKRNEGQIAHFLTELQEACQSKQIKIGSYPNWGEGKDGARVVVSVVGKDEVEVKAISQQLIEGIEGWAVKGKL